MLSSLLSDPSGSPFFLCCGLDSLPLSASQSQARAACLRRFSRVSPPARRRVSQGRGSCPCPAPSATSSATDICIPRRVWSNIFRGGRERNGVFRPLLLCYAAWKCTLRQGARKKIRHKRVRGGLSLSGGVSAATHPGNDHPSRRARWTHLHATLRVFNSRCR